MAHATGTRVLAAFLILVSIIPPFIQAVITLPVAIGLYRKAKQKEREKERMVNALEEQTA